MIGRCSAERLFSHILDGVEQQDETNGDESTREWALFTERIKLNHTREKKRRRRICVVHDEC